MDFQEHKKRLKKLTWGAENENNYWNSYLDDVINRIRDAARAGYIVEQEKQKTVCLLNVTYSAHR